MKKECIIILHYYFLPLSGAVTNRIKLLCKYFSENLNKDILVLTSSPDLLHFGYDYKAYNEISKIVKIEHIFSLDPLYILSSFRPKKRVSSRTGIKKSLLTQFYSFFRDFFFIGDDKFLWVLFVLKRIRKLLEKYDIKFIYTTSPPITNFFVAYFIKKNFRIPYVLDYRDPWYKNYSGFRFKTPLHFFFEKIWEKKILKSADGVVFNSHKTMEKYLKLFPFLDKNKVKCVYNGYDFDFLPSKFDEKISFIISGTVSKFYSPIIFFENLKNYLKNRENIQNIKVKILGVKDKKIVNYLEKQNLTKIVEYKGLLPHEEFLKELYSSHIAVLTLNPPIESTIIPNKIYDYIGARKFILYMGEKNQSVMDLLKKYKKFLYISHEIEFEDFMEKLLKNPSLFTDKKCNEDFVLKLHSKAQIKELLGYLKNNLKLI